MSSEAPSPAAPGRLPWTGSARRARDLGYAEAMREIADLAEDLLHGVHGDPQAERLLPVEALEAIHSYAFDVFAMHAEARMTVRNIGWTAGRMIQRDAHNQAARRA